MNYTKSFKARVALEAIRGHQTVEELSLCHAVEPSLIREWKLILEDEAPALFDGKHSSHWLAKPVRFLTGIVLLFISRHFLKQIIRFLFNQK